MPRSGIMCSNPACGRYHDIVPGSNGELAMYRVMLLGAHQKSFFCDETCYTKYRDVAEIRAQFSTAKINYHNSTSDAGRKRNFDKMEEARTKLQLQLTPAEGEVSDNDTE